VLMSPVLSAFISGMLVGIVVVLWLLPDTP
jgi:hypothetical protein